MRALKILKIVLFVLVVVTLVSFVVMSLWNWLMPTVFGLRMITFWQALGLLVLSKILLGGFHKHAGGRNGWKRRMEDRWAKMTPEERERFRAGMRGRCGFGPREEAGTEQSAR
jgi:heme/copper-type cytochrome/quinol oxidase subunit 1